MPILDPDTLEIFSNGTDQTRRVGMRLGGLLQVGDVICLDGDLGAGKTTLTQGIASGWGSADAVTSPTFVLVNLYRRPDSPHALHHLDAYRLSGPAEAEELDLDTMLANGPMVVEWADRIEAALPEENLWVRMHWVGDQKRNMQFTAHGSRYEKLLGAFQESVYGVR